MSVSAIANHSKEHLFQPGANGGSLLQGEARDMAMQAVMRGDTETVLALIERTTPFAPNSKPLFHGELFSMAVEEWNLELAMAMAKQAPLRAAKELGDSLLALVHYLGRRQDDAILPLVDFLLAELRKLGPEECAAYASSPFFERIYERAWDNTTPHDFDSDVEEYADEDGNLIPILPKNLTRSSRRSLLAFIDEFSPSSNPHTRNNEEHMRLAAEEAAAKDTEITNTTSTSAST